MSAPRPERGGASDFHGRLTPEYAPRRDGEPDPGEVVWVWVPYEEDPAQGKDRPVVVVGRDRDDPDLLVALMLSSKEHDGDPHWHPIGTGTWDGEHRPSWVRVDRPLALPREAVRREGSALEAQLFLAVVEHAAAGRDASHGSSGRTPTQRGNRRVTRLIGVYRANGGLVGETAYVVGSLMGRSHCSLCDVTHSTLRRKREWDRMVTSLGVPFELHHLNECHGRLQQLVPDKDSAPVVVAEVDGQLLTVLDAHDLEPLSGSVPAFELTLRNALGRHSLSLA